MKRLLMIGLIVLAGCGEGASDRHEGATVPLSAPSPDQRAILAIRKLNPNVQFESIGAAPIPNFRQVVVAGQVVYVSNDGRYLFLPGAGGALFDAQQKINLSEKAMAAVRTKMLRSLPASERIVFAPPHPKYIVTVFTDVECGYCRKLHNEMSEYNRQGIAIEYLAFPRAGIDSDDYKKMVAVWCSPDRRKALTDAKNDRDPVMADCETSVKEQYELGRRVGVAGTPMILAADGTQLGGYVPPKALRQALDSMARPTSVARRP